MRKFLLSAVAAALLTPFSAWCALPFAGLMPSAETPVKSITTIRASFNLSGEENMVRAADDAAEKITLVGAAGTVYATEASVDMESWPMNAVNIIFPTQTAEGTYTLTIPAGLFCEYTWDDATDSEVKVDGTDNELITATYTVSATAKDDIEYYTFDPEAGSEMRQIASVSITFPRFGEYDYSFAANPEVSGTFSNGTTTYATYAQGWGNTYTIYPVDADEEPVTIKDAGEWTLTLPAGAFVKMNMMTEEFEQTSPLISANFTVNPDADITYTCEPVNGGVEELPAGYAGHIYFTFDGASEVSLEPSDELAGIRVKFGKTELSKVTNAMREFGYSIPAPYYGDPTLEFIINPDVFVGPGVMTISIDAGAFTVDGAPSPAIEYSCTFGDVKEYAYVLTPAPGSSIESLAQFKLEFPEAKKASVYEEYIILRSNSWIAPSIEVEAVADAEYPTFNLNVLNPSTVPGDYSLLIDEGSFIIDGLYDSPVIQASYTLVKSGEVDLSWTASPEGDKLQMSDYSIEVSFVFSESEALKRNDGFADKITVKFDDEVLGASEYHASVEGNSLNFSITDAKYIGKEGTLSIDIAAGALLISGTESPAIAKTWQIVAPKTYEYDFSPASGSTVNSLDKITLTFANADEAEFFNEYGVFFRKSDYSYSETPSVAKVEGTAHPTFEITLKQPATADGNYVLSFNYGTFFLDGVTSSDSFQATYTVDSNYVGVGSVEAVSAAATVISIDGRVVLRNADADAVRALAPGFYIINGKKTFIK